MNRQQRQSCFLALGMVALLAGMWGISAGTAIQAHATKQTQQVVVQQDSMESGVAMIKTEDLRETLRLFAHKTLAGRGTLDGGYEFPSLFLARELRKLGIQPMGDPEAKSFFQEFLYVNRIESRNVIG